MVGEEDKLGRCALKRLEDELGDPVAGGGLLHRRAFLQGGVASAGAASAVAAASKAALAAATIGADSPVTMTRRSLQKLIERAPRRR